MLNPAVATGLLVAGEMDRRKWMFYVVAELIGAVFGALLAGGIEEKCFLPKENPEMTCLADYSHSNTGPGCAPDIQPDAYFRVFVRESVGTFILVSTVFATAIAKPGFGDAHARPYPVATFCHDTGGWQMTPYSVPADAQVSLRRWPSGPRSSLMLASTAA